MVVPLSGSTVGIEDQTVVLSFNISSDIPLVIPSDVRWLFDNGSVEVEIVFPGDGRRMISTLDRTSLTISPVAYTDEGKYILVAGNAAGSGQNSSILDVQGIVLSSQISCIFTI